ncbi:uncharacterized protein LOC129613113 [Condylostylus longicornis]|uniref:uncharacterized protein LOC129613113 n=1 Tax=Condylostylus longicornis TaxID=2530218 RepID=UPI00244E1877|nr:uncharacterized protein LOC129613113 [Condylostylus longicornis]
MILARTANNHHHQYHSVINRRSSASSSSSSSLPTGLSSNGIQVDTENYNKDSNENLDSVSSFMSGGTENNFWNDFSLFYKVYRQCAKEDLTVCLKIKLLAGLEKASRSIKEFNLISGIKFIRDDNVQENLELPISENEIISNLPRSLEAKDETLNNMILSKIQSFIKSHTLQIKFDDNDEVEERSSEGRKKKKGHGALIMIPLLLGGTFVPIAYGALALLAGKALIVSKLALVLASIIGIKKLLSGGGHKESEVVVSGGHTSGWGRDLNLPYSAYVPKDSTNSCYLGSNIKPTCGINEDVQNRLDKARTDSVPYGTTGK